MRLPSMETEWPLATPETGATWPDAGPRPDRPVRVGSYDLLERIGRGGLGDVFRARPTDGGPDVALKLLRGGDEASPAELRSFVREWEVSRRLTHANILPILDAGEHEGQPFYTMPLVEGGSLEKRLRTGRIDLRQGIALVVKVARAVQHAHHGQVLHRDLKPANILLGADDEPLVADFGLAKFLDRVTSHTVTGQLMGSLPYMSPEQAAGMSHRTTPATDIWSLGVVLYEVLTGQRPFRGESHTEVLRRIQHNEPPWPHLLRPGIPTDLERVCLRCLHKVPGQRYSTAGELADDLERWLAGQALAPARGSDETAQRALHHLPGQRLMLGVACVLGLLLILLAPPQRSATPAAPSAEEQRLARTRSALSRAQPGQPVPLLVAGQKPRWHRFVCGEEQAKLTIRSDRPAWLNTPGIALFEVVPPDTTRRGYRLSMELCQTEGDRGSLVGIYAGRKDVPTARGLGHTLLHALFTEPALEPFGQPKGSDPQAQLRMGYYHEPRQQAVRPALLSLPVPTATLPRTWDYHNLPGRTVRLEVRAESATLSVDGQPDRVATRQQMLMYYRLAQQTFPGLKGHTPDFSPAGGAGLIVWRSTVVVRRIVYEPAPGP